MDAFSSGIVPTHLLNREALAQPGVSGALPVTARSWRETGVEVPAVMAPGGNQDGLAAGGWDVPAPSPVLWADEQSATFSVVR